MFDSLKAIQDTAALPGAARSARLMLMQRARGSSRTACATALPVVKSFIAKVYDGPF